MYQYSFDDLKPNLSDDSSRTAFIDECGNFGFEFTSPGTSKHYIVCAICVKDNRVDDLENAVERIRKTNFGTGEMKSSLIGNDYRRRNKIIAELLPLEFRVILLVANKEAFIKNSPLATYKKSFIKFLHQRLYRTLYYVYPKLKIVEDQTGNSEFQAGFKKYVLDNRQQYDLFDEYDFDFIDSKDSVLIQLADIMGGTISKCYSESDAPNYLEMLQGKIIRIEEFPNRSEPIFETSYPSADKYNKEIYNLSIRCANTYISENEEDEDFEKRIQVAFLKYLLFEVYNVSADKFVSSSRLISVLSEYADKRITRDFLYRRVIAQLRESGVIISSCAQGYKIPTCVDDIISYLKQMNLIVSPMLHRVDICRKLIFQQTDRHLDILDNEAFIKYKKYFDE